MRAGAVALPVAIVVTAMCFGCRAGPLEPPPAESLDGFLTQTRGTAPAQGTIAYSEAACVAPEWTTVHPEEPTLTWPTFLLATIPDLARSHPSLELSEDETFVVIREPSFTEGLELEGPSVLAVTMWSGSDDVECAGNSIGGQHVIRTHFYGLTITDDEAFDAASAQADDVGISPVGDVDVAIPRNTAE